MDGTQQEKQDVAETLHQVDSGTGKMEGMGDSWQVQGLKACHPGKGYLTLLGMYDAGQYLQQSKPTH